MSPDNSFLGFAAGSHVEKRPFLKKKKRIVIYGDESSIYKVKSSLHCLTVYRECVENLLRQHDSCHDN